LADGQDPSLAKRPAKAAKAAASANKFDAIASELLDKKRREAKADRTLGKLDWLLGLARPAIGARPIGGLLAYRELDDALGLTTMAGDSRTGKNGRHALVGMLRQSVFGRLAGYEDVNEVGRIFAKPILICLAAKARWSRLTRASHSASEGDEAQHGPSRNHDTPRPPTKVCCVVNAVLRRA
jgi:hypothetical protein